MRLIRPEAREGLTRWREVLIGGAVTLLGAFWAFTAFGILNWLGWALVGLGALVAFAGFQRARFHAGEGGPGVVTIDEGQIAYFGPFTGGVVALSELVRLELDGAARSANWRLHQLGQPPLLIPVTSENADALFDVFATLPGLRTERMLAELKAGAPHPVVIWSKEMNRLH